MENNEIPNTKDVPKNIKKNGLVEVTIAVTGNSGVGKSSLINAITGLDMAETGVTETTTEPAEYTYPENKKIKFWDLPGIGTPNYPDLETYCKKVDLEKYDTFLILTASRFTENDLQLAKKVKSMKKSFLFVRTKIDQDIKNESYDHKKSEESTLNEIREDCQKNLSGLTASKKNVFLNSSCHEDQWDFPCLRKAILGALLSHQTNSIIFSLTIDSKDVIKQKVEVLRGRIWKVAAASAAVAVVPVPGLSLVFDFGLLINEMNLYKSQLGVPEENSEEFQGMTSHVKAKILKYCVTSSAQVKHLLRAYAASCTAEEFVRFIPVVGSFIAGSISFGSTYWFLHECLKELGEAAFKFFDETRGEGVDGLDLN